MIELVYIGERFYRYSHSMLSSIYKVVDGGYERYDYGFLKIALEEREDIVIRQAFPHEIKRFEQKLERLMQEEKHEN